jgi:hypothetical protein
VPSHATRSPSFFIHAKTGGPRCSHWLAKQATEDNILHEILERWHDSKKRFPKERWLKAIAWMKKEGFVPTGFGKPTKQAK